MSIKRAIPLHNGLQAYRLSKRRHPDPHSLLFYIAQSGNALMNVVDIVDISFLQYLGDVLLKADGWSVLCTGVLPNATYRHIHLHQRIILQIFVRVGTLVIFKVLETGEPAAHQV